MRVMKWMYETCKGQAAPYWLDYSATKLFFKPIRKWIMQNLAPNCVFNGVRVLLYRICGVKIGKHVFIGMKCYLDDMCYDLISIEDEVIISYGVYFACHGRNQKHYPIIIKKKAYVGMRANIISKNAEDSEKGVCIGEGSVVGACTLVNRDVPNGATAVGVPCRIIENYGDKYE